jgi:hypothetical protein
MAGIMTKKNTDFPSLHDPKSSDGDFLKELAGQLTAAGWFSADVLERLDAIAARCAWQHVTAHPPISDTHDERDYVFEVGSGGLREDPLSEGLSTDDHFRERCVSLCARERSVVLVFESGQRLEGRICCVHADAVDLQLADYGSAKGLPESVALVRIAALAAVVELT